MKRVLSALALLVLCGAGVASAQSTYVKIADEWGTIQPSGARTGANGIRFWNIEGANYGNFASAGTLRFYMADLVSQLDSEYGAGGWKIDNVTLVAEQQNAAFTVDGAMQIYHVSDDTVGFTNGASDGSPGDFSSLGVSPLVFDDSQTAKVSGADLGTVTLVNDYNYIRVDTFTTADVFGLADNAVDPAGAIDAGPTYGIDLPDFTASPLDEVGNFNAEIAHDSGDWTTNGFDTIVDDIQSGSDALSFIFAPGDASAAATYKGNFNIDSYPPRIYIQASAIGETLFGGDYNDDGRVDAADYTVWRDNLGNAAGSLENDVDGGLIGTAQYDTWKANFGLVEAGGGSLGASAVPEPGMLVLVGVLMVGLAARRTVRK
jgi:hypothetical protein